MVQICTDGKGILDMLQLLSRWLWTLHHTRGEVSMFKVPTESGRFPMTFRHLLFSLELLVLFLRER